MSSIYYPDPRLTAEDYERMARETATRKGEMLERNGGDLDDCFVSAACNDVMVHVYKMLATLVREGGKAYFYVLKTLDGEPVRAKVVRNRYGKLVWMVLDENDQAIGFAPYLPAHSKTLARRGYKEVQEALPAAVRLVANGRGMSALAGMYPMYVPDTRKQQGG